MNALQSPYEVPVGSVVTVGILEGPLQPFEQTQLKYLMNQVNAASPRVRNALIRELFPTDKD